MEETRVACKICVDRSEGSTPLGTDNRRREGNFKMDLTEMRF